MRHASLPLALSAVLTALPGGPVARAGEEAADPLAGLSGAKALALATELSADKMQGRKTGWPGGRRAEDWVANAMGMMGLDPRDAAGAYLEAFTFVTTLAKEPIVCTLDGKPLAYGTDYVDLLYSGVGDVEAPVVFVGHGIARPDLGWDEYAGIDVKGKVVLALGGAPKARAEALRVERGIGAKGALARERGAAAFLVCDGPRAVAATLGEQGFRRDLPALALTEAAADALLAAAGTCVAAERKRRDEGPAPAPLALVVKARVAVAAEVNQRARGANALGAIPGRDHGLRREVVVVSAHLDHLGTDAAGRVYHGADDNASGTAVMLHVAETLIEARYKPQRTILFVGLAGSAQGQVGARRLAESGLPFEHDAVVCLLHLERVGRGLPELGLAGAKAFPAFAERLLGYLPEAQRKQLAVDGDGEREGDHVPFAERGVPAFLLSTRGEHPDRRSLDDDAERLKPECLEAAARVLARLVVRLGDEPQPLKDAR